MSHVFDMPGSTARRHFGVWRTCLRNGLVRDMMFRGNFLIECGTSIAWIGINLCFYLLIFQYTRDIAGWDKYQYFVFLATGMFVNGLMQAFVMPGIEEFSELIRRGNLDFILLKPIDTQFLVSFQRVKWSSLTTVVVGGGILVYGLCQMGFTPTLWAICVYPLYVFCGVAILYCVMVILASTSVWMGRNQSLGDFWFYVTIFSRYPLEIYRGQLGEPIRLGFSFVVPILLAVNVPARFMARPMREGEWILAVYTLIATAVSLVVCRWVFVTALRGYRSASS